MDCGKVVKALTLLVLAGAVAGCVGEPAPKPGAQEDPNGSMSASPAVSAAASQAVAATPTAMAAASPSGDSGCYRVVSGNKVRLTVSVAKLSKLADLVVIGQVVSVGETRWATVDGKEPARSVDRASVDDVYRLATFRITRAGSIGSKVVSPIKAGSTVVVRATGGQIGCKQFIDERDPSFDVGQEIAVFLTIAPKSQLGVALPGDYAVMDCWWVYKGQVLVPDALPISIDEFIAESLGA